jgi:Uma2 family endonuclease
MIQAAPVDYYTLEEYLSFETQSQTRHEYIDGEIIPMVGGLPNHNLIVLNLAAALNFALKRKPHYVFATDQRLWIPQKRIYTYPDVMVVAGEIQLQAGRKDTITNPTVIVEVLSQSTQAYDQGDKFKAYRTITTFEEYVLINQSNYYVEQYQKIGQNQWLFSEVKDQEGVLKLNTIPFEMSLLDLYDKVTFENENVSE